MGHPASEVLGRRDLISGYPKLPLRLIEVLETCIARVKTLVFLDSRCGDWQLLPTCPSTDPFLRDVSLTGYSGFGRMQEASLLGSAKEQSYPATKSCEALISHLSQTIVSNQVTFPKVAGEMNTLPPANKVQQVVSADAQGGVRQTANIFAIQVTIDPADSPAGGLLDDTNRTLCVMGALLVAVGFSLCHLLKEQVVDQKLSQ